MLVPTLSRGADTAFGGTPIEPSVPTAELAAALLGRPGPVTVMRNETGVPGWTVRDAGGIVGHIGSTWEVAGSVGYSGRPLDILVAITPDAHIAGARLMRHDEPVLTLGISDADIAAHVDAYAGVDLARSRTGILQPQDDLPDVIARATVSTGVIRDGILRTARALALDRGLIGGASGIDRFRYEPLGWADLLALGGLVEGRLGMDAAARAFAGATVPVQPGPGDYLRLFAGVIDPPSVGRNLFGQQVFSRIVAGLGPGEAALGLFSSGLGSHRGADWRRTGVFERIAVVQGDTRWTPREADYLFVRALEVGDAPDLKEISIFRLPPEIDATAPFRIEITNTRPGAAGPTQATLALDYTMPDAFRVAPPPEPEPLWQSVWESKRLATAIVLAILAALTLILFAQESITRRPALWQVGRTAFLGLTLVVLGWGLNGQLSVVQVVAFVHSLLTGFRWETFLIDPVIFLLWSFVALGMLFWGRGVYCGWLCPFGALQELLNAGAQRLGVRQIAVPQALHERLWVIKYTLFIGILGLSFYSMRDALILAEVEPFKTAISLRMMRAWPFVAFVLALLVAGLFIERFFCRYMCPLGAGLAIPAKLKIFDWLKRRPQCGRECRLCETKCTVGAIDPLGRINPNECVLCLRCQVIMNDPRTCPVLKRRARGGEQAAGAGA